MTLIVEPKMKEKHVVLSDVSIKGKLKIAELSLFEALRLKMLLDSSIEYLEAYRNASKVV